MCPACARNVEHLSGMLDGRCRLLRAVLKRRDAAANERLIRLREILGTQTEAGSRERMLREGVLGNHDALRRTRFCRCCGRRRTGYTSCARENHIPPAARGRTRARSQPESCAFSPRLTRVLTTWRLLPVAQRMGRLKPELPRDRGSGRAMRGNAKSEDFVYDDMSNRLTYRDNRASLTSQYASIVVSEWSALAGSSSEHRVVKGAVRSLRPNRMEKWHCALSYLHHVRPH